MVPSIFTSPRSPIIFEIEGVVWEPFRLLCVFVMWSNWRKTPAKVKKKTENDSKVVLIGQGSEESVDIFLSIMHQKILLAHKSTRQVI